MCRYRLLIASVMGFYAVLDCYRVQAVQLALDPTFSPMLTQQWNQVTGFIAAPDGQAYVSAISDFVNGTPKERFLRLKSNGAVDPSFSLKTDSASLRPWLVRSDGKVLVTGSHFGWVNPDGTLGEAFPTWFSGSNGYTYITHIELLSDDKLLVGGGSFGYVGDGRTNLNNADLIRLNSDGTLDTNFRAPKTDPFGTTVFAVLPDSKLLFSAILADAQLPALVRPLIRLNGNGGIDPSFKSQLEQSLVTAILPEPDGKAWLAGTVQFPNNPEYRDLVRINPDGDLDTSVPPLRLSSGGVVRGLAREVGGAFIASGAFTSIGSVALSNYARILPGGIVDTNFALARASTVAEIQPLADGGLLARTATDSLHQIGLDRFHHDGSLDSDFKLSLGESGIVWGMSQQADGKLIVWTQFPRGYDVPRTTLARLEQDGSMDTEFHPQLDLPQGRDETPTGVTIDPKNRLLVSLSFVTNNYYTSTLLRLNSDGSRDQAFKPPFNLFVGEISAIAVQSDGKIIAGTSGLPYSEPVRGVGMARLNDDGTVDKTFTSSFTNRSSIAQITILPNDQVLVSGSLVPLMNIPLSSLFRLSTDGSLDLSFQPAAQPRLSRFFLSADEILFGADGDYSVWDCYGSVPILIRLDRNGRVLQKIEGDRIKRPNYPLYLEPDGQIVVGQGNRLARLHPDGVLDSDFGTGSFFLGGYIRSVRQILRQSDGAYILAGNFVTTPDHVPRNLIRLRPTDKRIPPLITEVQQEAQGNVVLSIFAGRDEVYQLQAARGLNPCTSAGWSAVTNVVGNGDLIQVQLPDARNSGYRFYRIGLP